MHGLSSHHSGEELTEGASPTDMSRFHGDQGEEQERDAIDDLAYLEFFPSHPNDQDQSPRRRQAQVQGLGSSSSRGPVGLSTSANSSAFAASQAQNHLSAYGPSHYTRSRYPTIAPFASTMNLNRYVQFLHEQGRSLFSIDHLANDPISKYSGMYNELAFKARERNIGKSSFIDTFGNEEIFIYRMLRTYWSQSKSETDIVHDFAAAELANNDRFSKLANDDRILKLANNDQILKLADNDQTSKLADSDYDRISKLVDNDQTSKLADNDQASKLAENDQASKLAEIERISKLAENERVSKFLKTSLGDKIKKDTDPQVTLATFPKFMELAAELRLRVYEYALQLEHSIRPTACDKHKSGDPTTWRFHDDRTHENTGGHNAIYTKLAITRTNKAVREESLPIFYSVNTFAQGLDTVQYFQALIAHGRFDLIRSVQFFVNFRKNHAARVAQEVYDVGQIMAAGGGGVVPFLDDVSSDANMFLAMITLAKAFDDETKRTVTLSVTVPERLRDAEGLKWFLDVAKRVSVEVKLTQAGGLHGCESSVIVCEWIHRLQNKDNEAMATKDAGMVMSKAVAGMPKPNDNDGLKSRTGGRVCFYRKNCKGQVTWYDEM